MFLVLYSISSMHITSLLFTIAEIYEVNITNCMESISSMHTTSLLFTIAEIYEVDIANCME